MERQFFEFYPYNWDITVFYNFSHNDSVEIMEELDAIGCKGKNLIEAYDNVSSLEKNKGLTFANIKSRQLVICISKATSQSQFFNTLVHELHHVAEFVARASNVPQTGEEISYIMGEIAMMMFPVAKKYFV